MVKVIMKMNLNNERILANFPPLLRNNFNTLFCNGKIGLSSISINDIVSTRNYIENDSSYSYYFTLKIPYAGKRLSWDIIFNPEDISFAPDFNFNDDSFLLSEDIDTVVENIPALVNWNVNNSKALTSVLKEFMKLYKKQQIQKLQQDNIYAQLNLEYEMLTERIPANKVEVFLDHNYAHFVVNIDVDVSSLPEYLQPSTSDYDCLLNPLEDSCLLKVSYLKLDGSQVDSSLQLSPRLDQVLNSSKNLHIPIFPKGGAALHEYVEIVSSVLQNHIKNIEFRYGLRKQFITCLCTTYAGNIVELDSHTFSKAKLMCGIDGVNCLISIELGDLFPEEKPTVILHSIYCLAPKRICSEEMEDYLYSPRWKPELMLEKIMSSLLKAIKIFKNHEH